MSDTLHRIPTLSGQTCAGHVTDHFTNSTSTITFEAKHGDTKAMIIVKNVDAYALATARLV